MSWQHDTITARQAAILSFIIEFTDDNGYPPSRRDIGKHFHIASTNDVTDHLKLLAKKGCVEMKPMLSRSVRVTDEGCRMLVEAVRA